MKKLLSVILIFAVVAAFASCKGIKTDGNEPTSPVTELTETEAVTAQDITASEVTGDFSVTTEDGTFSSEGNVYTISSAGTYTLTGLLNGQVLVNAEKDDKVVLELSGTTITNGTDSPVKIVSADKVEIFAKDGTENVINDTRTEKTTDEENQGEGAIYANCDLKLTGTGTLVINAAYNNGIHTTKDLKIQELSLKATARNNALKGNDSVTVAGGSVVALSTKGDGVKTENTDVSKKGNVKGDITISGGAVTVYAAGDGFQAAHDFNLIAGDGSAPTVTIHTGSYSEYTDSNASTTSYKGVKVQNELNVSAGVITVQSYDDGLHADSGKALEDGTQGLGNINITGGTVTLNVYAPENKTPGGKMGPGGRMGHGGWSGQQTVSGADGIHADSTLTISGGTINIDSAYEGLEANVINVSGGKTYVSANDDGVNACKGGSQALVNVTGGYLDVTVSPNGDTDGIDSNGSYSQTGGVVITRGPGMEMAAAIDADGSVTVSGGTLIVLGYGRVSTGGSVKSYSLSLNSSGSHTVNIDGTSYTFTNADSYARTSCYSDAAVSA